MFRHAVLGGSHRLSDEAMCRRNCCRYIFQNRKLIAALATHISLEEMIVNQVTSKLSINLLLIITAVRLPFARAQTREAAHRIWTSSLQFKPNPFIIIMYCEFSAHLIRRQCGQPTVDMSNANRPGAYLRPPSVLGARSVAKCEKQ